MNEVIVVTVAYGLRLARMRPQVVMHVARVSFRVIQRDNNVKVCKGTDDRPDWPHRPSYSQPCPRLTTECLERAPTSAPEPGPAPSSTHPVDGSHPVHSHPLCFYRHVTLCRRARRSSAANFYMGSRSLVILIVILQFGHSTFQLRPEAATVIIFIYSTYSIEGKLVHFFNLSDDNMVFNGLVE
ncbi:uncharacterized protein LOC118645636 isoform X1 [Monomorium pharaonis]|uniref:uncharacterized protein LOC118645636 isoform X1 n=1 Tax=Monomorium pharaonis TaxID=307658 RepID=UPI0017473A91|nr:uncharacterized protein LOC118645636 isoform X1 [Monomorium pharaonis]